MELVEIKTSDLIEYSGGAMKSDMAYHYCSIESFYGIILSKKMWLTDYMSTNDPIECKAAGRVIAESLKKIIYKDDKEKSKIDRIISMNRLHPFFACFSRKRDILSQWRGYGDDGKGVCLGFDIAKFGAKNVLPCCNIKGERSVFMHDVMYDECETIRSVESAIVDVVDRYNVSGDREKNDILIELAGLCSGVSVLVKSSTFIEERECRLVYAPLILSSGGGKINVVNPLSQMKWMCRPGKIVPYFEFDFNDKDELLKSVTLGPRSTINKELCALFLDHNLIYNVHVDYSSCRYR